MEDASETAAIPGWIWVVLALMIIGAIVVMAMKSDPGGKRRHRHRRHRSHRHSRRHRHRGGSTE